MSNRRILQSKLAKTNIVDKRRITDVCRISDFGIGSTRPVKFSLNNQTHNALSLMRTEQRKETAQYMQIGSECSNLALIDLQMQVIRHNKVLSFNMNQSEHQIIDDPIALFVFQSMQGGSKHASD